MLLRDLRGAAREHPRGAIGSLASSAMLPGMSAFELVETSDTVNVLRDGAAVIVEMNRPQVLNAWNPELAQDTVNALRACRGDDVRAVMVTGAGRAFSAGADLGAFQTGAKTPTGGPDLEFELHARYHPIMREIRRLEKPVLAAVDGPAAGIGMSCALSCDLVTVSERATMNHAFTRIGLGPDGGASLFLLARVGWTRAAEIMFEGRKVEAEEARAIGLVNRVVPTEGFRAAAEQQLRELAAGPTVAYSAIKRALNAQLMRHFEELLALEAEEQQRMSTTEDFVAAATAFVQRQEPVYRGR